MEISEADLHPHLQARMVQRGVTREEIEKTLNDGWEADDAKPGTLGKVRVYYKVINDTVMLLTVKARYGKGFPQKEASR